MGSEERDPPEQLPIVLQVGLQRFFAIFLVLLFVLQKTHFTIAPSKAEARQLKVVQTPVMSKLNFLFICNPLGAVVLPSRGAVSHLRK